MDEYSEQELETLQKDKKSKTKNFIKYISPKFLIIAAGVILVGMWAVNAKVFTNKQMTTIIIIAVIIILILAYQEMTKLEYLTYDQAAAIAEAHLEQRQKLMRDVPQGEIKPISAGKLQKVFGVPNAWSLGYQVTSQTRYVYEYEILIDPKVDGLGVIGVIPQKSGYKPEERKDIYPTQTETDQQQTGQFENQQG